MRPILFICLFSLCLSSVQSQDVNIFDQMLSLEEGVSCHLVTDMKKLTNQKHIEEYTDSYLIISQADRVDSFDVQIKTRGNSRKKICYYPPFKIKFNKDQLTVKEPNSFKLVNCCKNTTYAEQLLVKEYFVYKLYNLFTDRSLRAHLLNIEYVDIYSKRKSYSRPAIILENEEQLAERFQGVTYEPKVTLPNRIDSLQLAILTVFEYMIGNTDWNIGNQHNCMVVRGQDDLPFPIPYDFDYSGLVNADYAVPAKSAPVKYVTDRFNRGYCITPHHFETVHQIFIDKKEEVLQMVSEFTAFDNKTKKSVTKYLEGFYKDFEKEKLAKSIFMSQCLPLIKSKK